MTSKELIKKLNELYDFFSSSKQKYKILIDGNWGIGKTFTYNSFLKSKNNNKYYISLFGISSIEEVEKRIIQKVLFPGLKDLNKSSIIHALKTFGAQYVETKSGVNISDMIEINTIENLKFSEKSIICFDDLERLSDDISFKELLGLIERLGKKINVVVICNKSKLSPENTEIFNEYQEKIIDYYFYLDKIDIDFIRVFIKDWNINEKSKDFLIDYFIEQGRNNLRYLEKIETIYREINSKYIKNEWFRKNEKILLKAVALFTLEQYFGVFTKEYIENQKKFWKSLHPELNGDDILKRIEENLNKNSYLEIIPYDLKEIVVILEKYLKDNIDVDNDLKFYFENKEKFERIAKKINYWFLEDEDSIKNEYFNFKKDFIENLDIFDITYKIKGFIVLNRFKTVVKEDDDLKILENKIKFFIKNEMNNNKLIDLKWICEGYFVTKEEFEKIDLLQKEAEKESLAIKKLKFIEKILNLDFKDLQLIANGVLIEEIEDLKEYFDILIYKKCPQEYWDNLRFILKVLSENAKNQLVDKLNSNISKEDNCVIKTRNEFIKSRIESR